MIAIALYFRAAVSFEGGRYFRNPTVFLLYLLYKLKLIGNTHSLVANLGMSNFLSLDVLPVIVPDVFYLFPNILLKLARK